MSSSRIASMRFQSVLDGIFVFFPLFMVCLSKRDDANVVWRQFSKRHHRNPAPDHPKSRPPLLAIVLTRIRADKKRTPKHLLRPAEIETMLSQIGPCFGFVPFEIHCNSKCSYIQAVCSGHCLFPDSRSP